MLALYSSVEQHVHLKQIVSASGPVLGLGLPSLFFSINESWGWRWEKNTGKRGMTWCSSHAEHMNAPAVWYIAALLSAYEYIKLHVRVACRKRMQTLTDK